MPHKLTKDAKLVVEERAATASAPAAYVVRVGPVDLPANASHMDVAQMPDFIWSVPFTGWITGYAPRLTDAQGNTLPSRMLHHVAVWNTERSDFLCDNKEEHIFGAGGEMNQWPVLPGIGYYVAAGDKIRINTMFHNPTDKAYPAAYLEFAVSYQRKGAGPDLKNVYPAWFDVKQCGNSGYDLPAGVSTQSGSLTLKHDGALIGVGGHMHDYGSKLGLKLGETPPVELSAAHDAAGHLTGMPTVIFAGKDSPGKQLRKGETVTVSATYDNRSGHAIPEGAMGIVVGYFLPANDAEMRLHRRVHAMAEPIVGDR